MQLAAPGAQACGPFDYKITSKTASTRSATRGGSENKQAPPLAWAQEVTRDANTVHSDIAFFSTPEGGGWMYATADSGLSKANTLLEFYGYFSRLLAKNDKDQATNEMLRGKIFDSANADKFAGISVNALRSYPIDQKDANNALVKNAVAAVFGKDAPRILAEMEKQNGHGDEYGVKYFTRPAYLDSGASPGVTSPCMAIAYGQDYFTNSRIDEDLAEINKTRSPPMTVQQYRDEDLAPAFGIAMRSSIVDYAAAQAMKQLDSKTGKLQSTKFKIAGKIECELVPSTAYQLTVLRTRCGTAPDEKFYQANPVVRDVGEGRFRMVEVGFDLFDVDCKDSTGNTIRVSDANVSWEQGKTLFGDLMALGGDSKTPSGVMKDVGGAAEVLAKLPPADFNAAKKKVVQASNTCAKYIEETVFKRGYPSTGGTGTTGAGKPE
jgi:hypothetical protein